MSQQESTNGRPTPPHPTNDNEQPQQPQQDKKNEHTQLHTVTDATSSFSSSSLPAAGQRPKSPINRKRAEQGSAGQHHSQEGGLPPSPGHSSLPPLKKSKPSLPLSQANMTEYRSSQDFADDPLSPQTSPVLEPVSPATSTSSLNARGRRRSPPAVSASVPGVPIIPFLTRTNTLEEIRSSIDPSATTNSSEAAIENLSLGTRSTGSTARAPGFERAMGVITTSRQGSPALGTISGITSRESTPMHMEEEPTSSLQHGVSQIGGHIGLHDSDQRASPTPCDAMEEPEDACIHLNISVDYDEDADNDYEIADDTTVDENHDRVDTSESEDDDSFSDIDLNNIEPKTYDQWQDYAYHDTDPLCLDRLSDEEKEHIMDEAREHGIAYVIQEYIVTGVYTVKQLLLMTSTGEISFASHLTEADLISILTQRLQQELRRRHRLPHVHTLEHVIDLLKSSKRIMVLTGAGVSVSCGIPDFRSPDGIYSRLSEFELEDPTQMFELEFFCEKPQVFYSFAREIFPSNFTPSPSHNFIKLLEDQGKLLRNYTQNIDTLEQKAGIHNVLQCHGSFATASCVQCRRQVPGDDIKDAIMKQEVAFCKICRPPSPSPSSNSADTANPASPGDDSSAENNDEMSPAVMKPDIVFFGELLPSAFDDSFDEDRDKVDLLIVIGSSLKVAPVSDIMHQLPKNIPQILINRTPITHMEFDVQLLGNCDTIVAELCRMTGWELKHERLPDGTSNVPDMDIDSNADGSGKGGRAHWSVIEPNTYLFEGAILGDIEYESSQTSSKKRSRFHGSGTGGYDADSDEESGGTRRRSFARADRFSSPGFVDTDSDSDSGESQHTIRGSDGVSFNNSFSSSLNNSISNSPAVTAADSMKNSTQAPLFGFATGTTFPRSGSIPDIHLPQAPTLAQEPPLLSRSASFSSYVSQEYQKEVGDDEIKISTMYTEKMPKELGEAESMSDSDPEHVHVIGHGLGYGRMVQVSNASHRLSMDLGSIAEDPESKDDVGKPEGYPKRTPPLVPETTPLTQLDIAGSKDASETADQETY